MRKRTSERLAFPHTRLIALALIYLVVALVLLPRFRFEINPDGISYIAIARKILAGQAGGAVNGYWGPLFSWLLLPFLALGLDPLLAGKLLSILIGLVTLPGLSALSYRFEMSERLRTVVLAALLPALWQFTFHSLSPDFLVVCILVHYFAVVLDGGFAGALRKGATCGVLGGLVYLAKAYGFHFFLAHFTLTAGLLLAGATGDPERRAILRTWLLGLGVLAAIAGPWAATLSAKYGRPTLATTGAYNHALVAPGSRGQPMHYRGFMAPHDPEATSVWEDPSFIPLRDWSPLTSAATMKHQLALLAGNARMIWRMFSSYSLFALVTLLAYVLFCVQPIQRSLRPGGEAYPLLALLLYPAGYALVLVQERYLFVCVVLLALMGGHVVQRLAAGGFLTGRRLTVGCLLLAGSIAAQPLKQTATLARQGGGRNARVVSGQLAQLADLRGRIASNREWVQTLFIAYHLGLTYCGEQGDTPAEAVPSELARLGVRYFFVWSESPTEEALYRGWPEITGGAVAGLKVYRVPPSRGPA